MKNFWVAVLGLFEDAKKGIYLLPSFLGLILLITSGNINSNFHISRDININPNMLGLLMVSLAFLLWGVQGLIFAIRKQFPVLFLSIKGKAAILLGVFLLLICLMIAIRGFSLAFSKTF